MKSFLRSFTSRMLAPGSGAWLPAACCLWLVLTAGVRPLMLPDEGRYVGIAWEMFSQGNWLVPTLDGMPFFHKPPLLYWLTMAGLELFGRNEWAVRLASTASAVLAVLAFHAFVRKHRDQPTANLATVILVTQPFFFGGAQFVNCDMLVASMISMAIMAGADAVFALERGEPYRRSLAAGYICAALGVLAKGLIGIMLPGAILFAWIAVRRRFRVIPRLINGPLILLFFAIAVPWFVRMEQEFPGFLDYFFIYHHFHRYAETGFNNQQAFWFYFPVLLLLTLPWSPWIFRLLPSKAWKLPEGFAIRSLALLWMLGILVFFSIPKSKLIGYILPALPPFALLLAETILRWRQTTRNRNANAWIAVNLVAAGSLCLAVVIVPTLSDRSQLAGFTSNSSVAFPADAQLVMLDEYQYDMPFYLKGMRPPWVVSNWLDPSVAKKDNWRKEIYDASRFAPDARRERLMSLDELPARLCASPEAEYWIWGKKDFGRQLPMLSSAEIVFSNQTNALWRLESRRLDRASLCGGTPSSG